MSKDFFPEAYRKGFCEFYGRDFFVSHDTLIPRPETEQIVDLVLSLFGKTTLPGVKPREAKVRLDDDMAPRILDVGTGTGCIGLTLKMEIPEAEVVLSDVSLSALDVVRKNAEKFSASVETLESDLLARIKGDFEIIVANLPYVDRGWGWLESDESQGIKFEPEIALFAEDGGCELIFRLIKEARERAKYLVLEADPSQHERIIKFAEKNGWKFTEKQGFGLVFTEVETVKA